MKANKVVVLGGGVLGSQIAYQSAFSGIETVIYDINDAAIDAAWRKIDQLPDQYIRDLGATNEQLASAKAQLSLTLDLETAITDADVIIEAVSERLSIKESLYKSLKPYIGDETLLLTNTSTLLPSQLVGFAPNPNRFAAMHFANQIWVHNVAEIMWAPTTPQTTIDDTTDFAKQINMLPILIQKETSGYIMNSIFLPMINAALFLWADDVADPQSIDRDWMTSMGVDRGPFGSLDIMGLNTAINIEKGYLASTNDARYQRIIDKLQLLVDANRLGVATGQGFYHYPEPEYQATAFTQV